MINAHPVTGADPPLSSGGVAAVHEMRVLISCATDVSRFRRIGRDVIERINQMFTYGHPVPVRAIQWEYSQDIPGMSPRGDVASRSRQIVEMSHVVAVILGPRLGQITAEEVRATLEFRRGGVPKGLMLFRWNRHSDASFEQLQADVIAGFEEDPRWDSFDSPMQFQALFFTSLIPHMLSVASPSYEPVLGGVAS